MKKPNVHAVTDKKSNANQKQTKTIQYDLLLTLESLFRPLCVCHEFSICMIICYCCMCVVLQTCNTGEEPNGSKIGCTTCSAGTYSNDGTDCVTCPAGNTLYKHHYI